MRDILRFAVAVVMTITAPLLSIASAHSGLCWDVPNGTYTPGAVVQQYPCGTGNNQNWNLLFATTGNRLNAQIRSVGNPAYCVFRYSRWFINLRSTGFFANEISGVHFAGCVDIPNGSMANSIPLQTYNCQNSPNQTWLLVPSQ
jgi:hypothetical protein